MDSKKTDSGSVIRKILDWSQSRPMWQRDALRRIFQNVTLFESDFADLLELMFLTGEQLESKAEPLLVEHLPSEQTSEDSVLLESISRVKGVNNLAENQELLFSPNGLTVVYGDNGAGKSGYTRILKSACRARHRSNVLPNVFDSNQPSSISSLINYSVGQDHGKEFRWQNEGSPHPELTCVSVFDRECASVHIQKKNEVAYRPFGLDIPDKLAEVSKALEGKLKGIKQTLEQSRNEVFQNSPWATDTEVGKKIADLSKDSELEEFNLLSKLLQKEEERQVYLAEALSKDVSKAAKELENFAKNIEALIRSIENINEKLGDNSTNELIRLKSEANKLQETADLAAKTFFTEDILDGVGSHIWKELWLSAKKYSEEVVYPDRDFPATDIEDKCLLCQQPLGDIGSYNLKKFDEFVKSDVQDRAKTAKTIFEEAFGELPTKIKLGASWPTIQQLCVDHPEIAKKCLALFASARVRLNCVKKVLFDGADIPIYDLKLPSIETLNSIVVGCRAKAEELIQAEDAEKYAELQKEQKELQDRKTLQAYLKVIEGEILRLNKIYFIDQIIAETHTRSITTLGNSIADEVVTPHLRDSFLKEIIEFVGNRFRVEINRSGGSYGSPEYKVSFLSDPRRDVTSVLSEGEQTCVAVASFLAEQSTANHKSALVFDDPISSLDHKWRSIVAKRLVKEANDRQVIIFTHDLVFLNDLEDYAERFSVPFESKHLDRRPEVVGLVNDSLPWDGMKIKARIDALEKEARELGRQRNNLTEMKYKDLARSFYSKLRTSWERALEEVGLSHTVMRHRDYINPKYLKNISVLDLSDCESWGKNYGLCCDYVAAHDGSRGRNQSLPEPDELLNDVQALSDWVSGLKDKHKTII